MDLSTAIKMFLKQAVDENRFPFLISRECPNKTTLAAMEDAENGKNMYGPFDSVGEMMDALNA